MINGRLTTEGLDDEDDKYPDDDFSQRDDAETEHASTAGMSGAITAPPITLAPQQAEAVDEVAQWLEEVRAGTASPYYYLGGYAGTGKTTIAKKLASLQNRPTYFATFTGKAARVLRSKGCPASTIHSLIYLPQGKVSEEIAELDAELHDPDNPPDLARRQKILKRLADLRKPSFKKNEKIPEMGMLVLDECSMIDKIMGEDLLALGIPLLVLGDPGQLPPIKGTGFFTSNNPDYMLTEIHRQAAESPVLQLATAARQGLTLKAGKYGESFVGKQSQMDKAMSTGVDQILVGGHKARKAIIAEMRQLLGFEGMIPRKGEKLICLRNNHKDGILNGQMFTALSDMDPQYGTIDVLDDDGDKNSLAIHPECFSDPELVAAWPYSKRVMRQEFDYGYAITGHKSQGSEWPSVTVFAEMFRWDPPLFRKWLYTAITRASERVNVLL